MSNKYDTVHTTSVCIHVVRHKPIQTRLSFEFGVILRPPLTPAKSTARRRKYYLHPQDNKHSYYIDNTICGGSSTKSTRVLICGRRPIWPVPQKYVPFGYVHETVWSVLHISPAIHQGCFASLCSFSDSFILNTYSEESAQFFFYYFAFIKHHMMHCTCLLGSKCKALTNSIKDWMLRENLPFLFTFISWSPSLHVTHHFSGLTHPKPQYSILQLPRLPLVTSQIQTATQRCSPTTDQAIHSLTINSRFSQQ